MAFALNSATQATKLVQIAPSARKHATSARHVLRLSSRRSTTMASSHTNTRFNNDVVWTESQDTDESFDLYTISFVDAVWLLLYMLVYCWGS